jgi:hypothetical protein
VAKAKGGTCGDWIIRFSNGVRSQRQANNWVYGMFFQAWTNAPVVVVLPQRNAKPGEQMNMCRWLKRFGISALRLSIPYHDWMAVPGHPRADFLVGPNIGLTLIGIGGAVARSPLPHHRTCGSAYGGSVS